MDGNQRRGDVAVESWVELGQQVGSYAPRLQERLGPSGGQLRLIKLDSTVERILELTRLDLAFETQDTIELAVRSLR